MRREKVDDDYPPSSRSRHVGSPLSDWNLTVPTEGIGLIGLGKMGSIIAERLGAAGFAVHGFDQDPVARPDSANRSASLPELLEALTRPRLVWLMLPGGGATNAVLDELAGSLDPGDIIVDGGNSDFRDSQRQATSLGRRGIGFLDAGVSGGVWGRDDGFGITVGGDASHVARAQGALAAVAAADAWSHVGASGSGHFAKMIHNAVEYGVMQAYAEGYELLTAAEVGIDVADVLNVWQNGCSIRSWLLGQLVTAHEDNPGFTGIRGWADDSGMGRWAAEQALARAVPIPVIAASLFARFSSRQEDSPAMQAIAALRQQIGGHAARATST
jgi:6-phosphogluconate dehydrogenase